ncbi:MAG: carbon-nitrogen hydrolase family protein [Sedimentisphaerales bacterium]|nr:carbon-nitrogen hydrolase family protein [Sedimentisphaerales bacterium]
MFERLIAAITGPTFWGIVLIAIILLGASAQALTRKSGLKIALCQIFIVDGDRQGNFTRIENAIIEATSKGASIVCFPEASMLGWLNSDAYTRACTIPGPDSDQLCALAKKYAVFLCIGIEEIKSGRLHNSAVVISDQGDIILKHRQVNVPEKLMSPPYTPGADVDICTVKTRFGRIGVLVCADTHSDCLLKRMANLKPDLLLVPYGYAEDEAKWPAHGQEFMRIVVNAATTTKANVVGTNLVGRIIKGPWSGKIFGGQSVAVDKTGKILAVAKDRDRDIKIISINTAMQSL